MNHRDGESLGGCIESQGDDEKGVFYLYESFRCGGTCQVTPAFGRLRQDDCLEFEAN